MRPSLTTYFMMLALAAAQRSTCPRRSVGAVLTKAGRVISTGYNGAPPKMSDCLDDGCLMYADSDRERCINTIHAELNALIHAKEVGDLLVTTDQPCINCLKAALSHNPEIQIVYLHPYADAARDHFVSFHQLDNLQAYEHYHDPECRLLRSFSQKQLEQLP